jgi:hypothetical protein
VLYGRYGIGFNATEVLKTTVEPLDRTYSFSSMLFTCCCVVLVCFKDSGIDLSSSRDRLELMRGRVFRLDKFPYLFRPEGLGSGSAAISI